jgi:periplasmic divalent cation tolerance protein
VAKTVAQRVANGNSPRVATVTTADNGTLARVGKVMSEKLVFVYTTYPSLVEAENAGRRLVERRLAACVNILPGMVSHYWWEGTIERGEEVVMIIKTRASLVDRLCEAVKQTHAYTTPAIAVLPIEGGDLAYLGWLLAETAPPAAS